MTERGLRLPEEKSIDFDKLFNTLYSERIIPLNQRPRHKLKVSIPLLPPHPDLPQRRHSEEYLNQLANSIRTTGMLYPPICTLFHEQKKFPIVCGNARVKSASITGLRKIEIAVMWLTTTEAFKFSISENLERHEFHPLEEAEWYSKWVEKTEMRLSDVAREIHRSLPHVSNRIRLLMLPERVKELLWQNKISAWDSLLLLKVKDNRVQIEIAEMKAKGLITATQLEQKINEAVLRELKVPVEITTPPTTSSSLTLPRRPTDRELLSQISQSTEEQPTQLSELDLARQRLTDLQERCSQRECEDCTVRDECFQFVKCARFGGREVPEPYQKLIKWLREKATIPEYKDYYTQMLRELGFYE